MKHEHIEEEEKPIRFKCAPVRARHDGWTEERQRGFIAALRRIGSVSTAAKTVGKTRAGAYRLRQRPGAESFARAWDRAAEQGCQNVHDSVIDRALHGAVVPRFYAGRQTGVVHRFYDSIAIAVLSGRGVGLAQRLEEAEERGARKAFFNIERAWQSGRQVMREEQDARVAAEGKLKRLAAAGVIGPEWLDPGIKRPPLPKGFGPQPLPVPCRRRAGEGR